MNVDQRRLILILLFLAGCVSLPAQQGDLAFTNTSIEQGLSQSIVDAILQDQKGFMWFVTEDGLNRFDGYTFTVFKHDAKDPFSLAHNEIKSICAGRDGILWVGSFYRGLERFDPATGRFTHFAHDPANPASLSNDIVWAVLEDRAGRLWVGTGGGLNRLDSAAGAFRRYRHDPRDSASISHDDVRTLYEDKAGRIWVGTAGGGLNRLDPVTGRFTRFRHDPADPQSLSHDDVRAIREDPDGTLWVGTFGGGLDCLDPATGKFRHFRNDPRDPRSLASDNVMALQLDEAGTLWAGTDGGGLNRFNPRNGAFTRYLNAPNRPDSLPGNRIYSLYLDRSGILWIGTYGNGLSRCDLHKKRFVHYLHDPNDPNSLSHNIVWCFWEEPDGVLWVGTNDGGLNCLDRAGGRFTRYLHDPADPRSLSHNSVRMVRPDRDGTIWVATNGGGLDRLDPKTGVFRHYRHDPADPASLSHDELRMVFRDRRDTIWVGTYGGGLDRWDPATGGFVHYRSDPADPATISNDYVRTALEDDDGRLWFGTHGGGLNRFDRATGKFTRYRNDPRNPASLSNDFVFCIHPAPSGALWIATYGGGLNRMDPAAETFTALRKSDGLPDDVVYGILEDRHGNLWLSTNSGITRYNPAGGSIRSFTMADGLQSNEFNGGSFYQNRRGEMFFGGINGFNVFRPDLITDDRYRAPVVLTDFQLFNRAVPLGPLPDGRTLLTRSIAYTDRIELGYRDRVVSFEFASLDFATPEKNRYAYKLEGLDRDWIDFGTHRRVMFTTLPAGRYTLRVKGTNSDGVWNETGAALALIVRPPWWSTNWAFAAYALALVGLVLLVTQFVKGREREKGRLVAAELRARAAELQSRTAEAEARALKVENDRKTQELENARRLQLSMLPTRLPEHPRFAIAARMETATEVGGDYYDFHLDDDHVLTVAIGDATGHGTRAGIMVAIMKALFARLCAEPDLRTIFHECNRTLIGFGMEQMFMGLGLLRIAGADVRTLGAAVPSILVFRADSGRVDQILLQGMFLGTDLQIPLDEEERFTLKPGDKVLLLSDGYIEQMNQADEMLDYGRCTEYFQTAGRRPPEEIIDHLFGRFTAWRGPVAQADDVTLIVLEFRG